MSERASTSALRAALNSPSPERAQQIAEEKERAARAARVTKRRMTADKAHLFIDRHQAEKIERKIAEAVTHRPTRVLLERLQEALERPLSDIEAERVAFLLHPTVALAEKQRATEDKLRKTRKTRKRSSKVTGVSFNRRDKRWIARETVDGSQRTIGSFVAKKDAEAAILSR